MVSFRTGFFFFFFHSDIHVQLQNSLWVKSGNNNNKKNVNGDT